MCPASRLWRRLISLIGTRLYESGVKALYFDEVPMSAAWPCYDKAHGHPPGGGPTFVDSYNEYFRQVREEVEEFAEEIVMTSEGCAEPYIRHLDALLIGNGNDPHAVPLFEAVYHDYVMGFGRYTFTPELVNPAFEGAIISKHAQQFVWGCQFGWSRIPLGAIIQKDPMTAGFLKNLAHTWIHNNEFLAGGRMLRPLDFSSQLEPVKRRWARAWNDEEGTEVQLMPVLNSVWRIDDGSIGVVLVNITREPVDLHVQLPSIQQLYLKKRMEDIEEDIEQALKSSRYYPLPQNTVGQLRRQQEGRQEISICDGDTESGFDLTVPPLECVVIAIGSEKQYGVHGG
jgi:hypothetical protein